MRAEKYCKRCDQTLSSDKFTKSVARYDGLQAYCQECMKKYRLEHYARNRSTHYARNNVSRAKLRNFLLEIKSNPCVDCQISYPGEPWLMEFDHRDPSNKSNEISYLVSNGSKSKLQEELAKCDLVCVVCHRRRTAAYFGWIDNRLAHVLE